MTPGPPDHPLPTRERPASSPKRRARWRRLGSALIGIVLAFTLLELGLQIAAGCVWLRRTTAPRPTNAARTALCVGDSFTFGLGTSTPGSAWPSVAARRCTEAGAPIAFINAAWPGSNSGEVLAGLGARLAEWRPQLLYVLVGTNDRWSQVSVLPPGAEETNRPAGFVWRLRSLRLLCLLGAALQHRGSAADTVASRDIGRSPIDAGVATSTSGASMENTEPLAPDQAGRAAPFVGEWRLGDRGVAFDPDGRLIVGRLVLHWTREAEQIRVRKGTGEAFVMHFELDRDTLRLRIPWSPEPIELRRGLPAAEVDVLRARELVSTGQFAAAEAVLRSASASSPRIAEELVNLLQRSGQTDAAGQELEGLRAAFATNADPALGETLLRLLIAVGDATGAQAVAVKIAALKPGVPGLIGYAMSLPATGDEAALAIASTAIAATERAGSWNLTALWLRLAADRRRTSDPSQALADLARAYHADHDDRASRHFLRRLRGHLDPGALDDVLARQGLSAEIRAQWSSWLAEGPPDGASLDGVLTTHLARMVRLARIAGAEPVLLSYPRGEQRHADTARSVADDLRCGWLDLHPAFAQAMRTHTEADLFIADGHCTDAGYRIIGETIAADALQRLGR